MLDSTSLLCPLYGAILIESGGKSENQQASLENMPDEVRTHMNSFLDKKSLGTMARVSHNDKRLAEDDATWKALYHKDFPEDMTTPAEGQSWKSLYKSTLIEQQRVEEIINQKVKTSESHYLNLDLGGNVPGGPQYLSLLPENMGDLIPQKIHTIRLMGNRLTYLPSSMAKLTWTNTLDLQNNQLKELPSWLKNWTKLAVLIITGNPLDPQSVIEYLNVAPLNL